MSLCVFHSMFHQKKKKKSLPQQTKKDFIFSYMIHCEIAAYNFQFPSNYSESLQHDPIYYVHYRKQETTQGLASKCYFPKYFLCRVRYECYTVHRHL